MDPATITIIVLVCVNIVTSSVASIVGVFQLLIKSVKKSECCGGKLEMRDKQPSDTDLNNKQVDNDHLKDFVELIKRTSEPKDNK